MLKTWSFSADNVRDFRTLALPEEALDRILDGNARRVFPAT